MKNKNSKKYIKKQQKKKQLKRQKAMSKRAGVLAEKKEKREEFAKADSRRRVDRMLNPTTYKHAETIMRKTYVAGDVAEQVFGNKEEVSEQDNEELAEE